MMRTLTAAALLAVFALGLFAQPAHAGLLQAIDTAMNNYANNIVKQGEQATTDVRNGSIKNFYNDAFVNYANSFHQEGMLGGDALKDSKAIFAEIKKIVMWVPNKIREAWVAFIDALTYVRDRIGAAGPGWPPPNAGGAPAAASESPVQAQVLPADMSVMDVPMEGEVKASAGLGDGFLGKFSTATDFSRKWAVFTNYQYKMAQIKSWFASLKPEEQKALTPNLSKVAEEASTMEDMFARDIAGSHFDAFVTSAGALKPDTAKSTIRGLLAKTTQLVNMQYLGNRADKAASKKVEQLKALKTKLGL
jgi:hypothetical protein